MPVELLERKRFSSQPKTKKKSQWGMNFSNFQAIKNSVASPEQILSWSFGEVRKPETINYRSLRPERDGLFCERIFGPVRDWECNCGKYKYIKYRGTVCDRCGVEVTESSVRRERMGHIELAVPVTHIWYLRKSPSRIGALLDMKLSDIERVTYYAKYVVLEDCRNLDGKVIFRERQLLSEEELQKAGAEWGTKLKVGIGASALRELLEKIDIKKQAQELRHHLKDVESEAERARLLKKLRVLESFLKSGNRPEWMVLKILPVIPPDLRPLVPLEGGRFATSDLNDLYRRIINRNNRLKHIEALHAPDVMIHNEKRMLQEAVDALIENGARGKAVVGAGNRPLKSLSDVLRGKQGRFRQNLLGKRVDYSGRSVIVVGPNLKMNQCGLPKEMALELFKPFIIRELMEGGTVTLKTAKRMLERTRPEVWDILERITKRHPILLNRAPTLHRLGIQAFEPVLVEGKSIQLHPLTCAAFNADFDGDQMAVHLPISLEAQLESRLLMMSTNNILSPASGKPVATPSQDMVLGCCYLTKVKAGVKGEGKLFYSPEEVITAYQNEAVDLNAKIKVRGITQISEPDLKEKEQKNVASWKHFTTVGRIIFNQAVPPELGYINQELSKKELANLVERCYRTIGHYQTVQLLDSVKALGYRYATISAISISLADMVIPPIKEELIKKARSAVREIEGQAKEGIITDSERYNKVIDIWTHVTDNVGSGMFEEMKKRDALPYKEGERRFNSVYMMAHSGARGSLAQVRQLAGMRGLMAKPQKKLTGRVGEIIEQPVLSNFREGLTVLEYFISTHGGRKGLADTALKTADAGYLTRRLVDAAHDIVITEEDCGTINGVRIGSLQSGDEIIEPLEERVMGRVVMDHVASLFDEQRIVESGEMVTPETARKIAAAGIDRIRIRSVLTCESEHGVCSKCYGLNLATGKQVKIGEAVGIIAAQSIGEPGTQLTLRTFHIGGTASRVIKRSEVRAGADGAVQFHNVRTVKNKEGNLVCVSRNSELSIREVGGKEKEHYAIPYGARLKVSENKRVSRGELLAEWDPYALPIIAEEDGVVNWKDIIDGTTLHEEKNRITGLIERVIIEHRMERLHPRIVIMNKTGKKEEVTYPLPVDTNIVADHGESVKVGDVLAKIPQEVTKTKDITGGLPRVAELFEARRPRNSAVISEIDGVVKLGTTLKGNLKVVVTNEETGVLREYQIPQGKHLVVYEGDRVGVGETLTDGSINPHDILKVKGAKECQEHLVNEIQEVYRLQGVTINDKHIEVVVRQMLSDVRVTKSGDTTFLVGEVVSKKKFIMENQRVLSEKGEPSHAQPVLLGITKAALSSDSFISAASFQETTRILTDAAISGEVDHLRGLKENVIIGHLIPAGSGLKSHQESGDEEK